MKKLVTLFLSFTIVFFAVAQKGENEDYKKMKEEFDQKTFSSKDSIFESNAIPAEYKNESSVILAQKKIIEAGSKKKLFTGKTNKSLYEIFRAKVYINDQSSLDDYSEIPFTKLQGRANFFGTRYKNYTFINIQVIKPDGTIKLVDVDESTITLMEKNDSKKTKIAVPNLGIGDIVDYYYASFRMEDVAVSQAKAEVQDLTYVLSEDAPVLNYELSLKFDKHYAIQYQAINGAPDFTITPNEEDETNLLKLKMQNLPKSKNLLWGSIARQVPIIRLKYSGSDMEAGGEKNVKKGEIVKGNNSDEHLQEDFTKNVMNNFRWIKDGALLKEIEGGINDANMKKRDSSKLSKANFINTMLKWSTLFSKFTLQSDYNRCYVNFNLYQQRYLMESSIICFERMLRNMKTEVLITTGRTDVRPDDAFAQSDFSILLRTIDDPPQYYSFDNNLNLVNEIPPDLEGEKAKIYAYTGRNHENGYTVLPVSTYLANASAENLSIAFDAGSMQTLKIKRSCIINGHLRKDKQAALASFEDMAMATAKNVGVEGESLLDINYDRPKRERLPEAELAAKLKEAKVKQKEWFEKDVEEEFDTKAKEVKSYKINNCGVSLQRPSFEFEEEFTMDGWVKKAGSNYIVDAGKFIGGQFELKPEQRDRKIDVYMPFARSFNEQIEFIIPDGYTAEGIDKFNKKVENECGAFKSSAVIEGNKLIIKAFKFYKNAYEPVANWGKLAAFIDEATQFNKEKILLKKK